MVTHVEKEQVRHFDVLFGVVLELMVFFQTLKLDPGLPSVFQKISERAEKLAALQGLVQELQGEVTGMHTDCAESPGLEDMGSDELLPVIDELKAKVTVLVTKVSTYEAIVADLNSQIERDAHAIQRMEQQKKQNVELQESLERRIKAQDRVLALKDVALAEQYLRIQSLEMASYDGILVWKIADFKRKKNEAISGHSTSIYSPYFYTSHHGYKMRAQIYLNGDGMGKGSHISLFFIIMKGQYDSLLQWPFGQKVSVYQSCAC